LIEAGVPVDYVRRAGVHSIGASTFREHILPRLIRVFSDGGTAGTSIDPHR
jgi:hypothetical protein